MWHNLCSRHRSLNYEVLFPKPAGLCQASNFFAEASQAGQEPEQALTDDEDSSDGEQAGSLCDY